MVDRIILPRPQYNKAKQQTQQNTIKGRKDRKLLMGKGKGNKAVDNEFFI